MRGISQAFRRFFWVILFSLTAVTISSGTARGDLIGGLEDPYPLRPADTASPRDTLRSFIRIFNTAVKDWRNLEERPDINLSLRRAADTLDFSELPSLRRDAAMVVHMVLLKEILDRVELPPFNEVPGVQDVTDNQVLRWTVPNTEIEIAKIEEGPRAGHFVFTKNTVANLHEYYRIAQDLPYKQGATVGIYDEIRYSAGPWISKEYTDRLPAWSTEIVLGQGVWQWIFFGLLLVVAAVSFVWLYRMGKAWDELTPTNRPWRRLGIPLALTGIVGAAELVYRTAQNGVGMIEEPLEFVAYLTLLIQIGGLAWLALVIAGRFAELFAYGQSKPEAKQRADAALMRIVFRLISIIILVYLAIYAAEAVGIPLAPLVAGLGVSGLAIALAVRPTLENIIGGLTLFADRPVRVGDFCRYGDQVGTVEQIGLRSTRIRSLERTMVSIPNAEFSQMQLDNYGARDQRLLNTVLQLRYETTPDQLRYVLAKLRELLLGHPKVTPEPARVRFVGFGAYSLDLEVFAYLRCQDQDTFLAIKEDVLLRMADIVNGSGAGFAFPSQTAYLTRDSGVSAERRDDAEAEVRGWRLRSKLPFPEFEEEERERLEDTLDYPPQGSPDHESRVSAPDQPTEPVTPATANRGGWRDRRFFLGKKR